MGICAFALYDSEVKQSNELEFSRGDLLTNITEVDERWLNGTLKDKCGLIPRNRVHIGNLNFTNYETSFVPNSQSKVYTIMR